MHSNSANTLKYLHATEIYNFGQIYRYGPSTKNRSLGQEANVYASDTVAVYLGH